MDSFQDLNFEYDGQFPQWDFGISQNELTKFDEKYGTVEPSFIYDCDRKMLNLQVLEDVAIPQLDNSTTKGAYSLRKNPKRKMQCFLGESSLKLRQTFDPSLFSSERGRYSARKDIVMKAVLRGIRRFYLNIFRSRYPPLFLSKTAKAPGAQVSEAVQEMCVELFSEEVVMKYKLHIFMQTLLNLKSITDKQESSQEFKSANQVLKCCKSFSSRAFSKVCDDSCFQKICSKIRSDFEEEFLTSLKGQEHSHARYREVLNNFCE
ncbi:unnamed protein product [Moneuplotes crassus]|uniref:Uncharacterized protein n=1 Tax=Euplotes crassus TaxID=5936 RepID=A0AAD1UHZ2_EUPCR|nr:unnamed protein product [Moneuplotes crassus]